MSHVIASSVSADRQRAAPAASSIPNTMRSHISSKYDNGCTLENCVECSVVNDKEYCLLCYGENMGPDSSGLCGPCYIDNCRQCNTDMFDCELCIDGDPPVMDECGIGLVDCTDPECAFCPNGPDFCSSCEPGYYLQEYCIPCMLIHQDCQTCADGMCTECSTTPSKSTSICVACDVIGCQYCKILYNDRNKSIIKQCVTCYQGYILMQDNSLCVMSSETSCAISNCSRCTTIDPIACLECDTSYALYQGMCVLCTIPNCLECEIKAPQGVTYETCTLCSKGYSPLVKEVQSTTPRALCVPILENINPSINPISFLSFVSAVFGLALLSVGCTFIYRLIERNTSYRS